ncbi:MAG: tol-pal system YbgF family protein [Candidatus Bruticola sp.]
MVKFIKIIVVFAVLLWVVNMFFGFNTTSKSIVAKRDVASLFSKDLTKKVQQGHLVIVDKNESDKYIQEDLATYDLVKAMTFARYKSEVLEQPLYIENEKTFGNSAVVAQVDPSDRQAWQHLVILEIDLKAAYEKKNPNDIDGYMSEKALDVKRVPAVMQEFISKYPNSYVVTTALAHIEYSLCEAQNKADQAIKIYDKLASRYPDSEVLAEYLPLYKERASSKKVASI